MQQQFSHDGGQRDFGRSAFGAQPLVERPQQRVVDARTQRGHVEGFARRGTTAIDVALAAAPNRERAASMAGAGEA